MRNLQRCVRSSQPRIRPPPSIAEHSISLEIQIARNAQAATKDVYRLRHHLDEELQRRATTESTPPASDTRLLAGPSAAPVLNDHGEDEELLHAIIRLRTVVQALRVDEDGPMSAPPEYEG